MSPPRGRVVVGRRREGDCGTVHNVNEWRAAAFGALIGALLSGATTGGIALWQHNRVEDQRREDEIRRLDEGVRTQRLELIDRAIELGVDLESALGEGIRLRRAAGSSEAPDSPLDVEYVQFAESLAMRLLVVASQLGDPMLDDAAIAGANAVRSLGRSSLDGVNDARNIYLERLGAWVTDAINDLPHPVVTTSTSLDE